MEPPTKVERDLEEKQITARRLFAAAISSGVWIYGIMILRWEIFEVQLFFVFDIFLFMSFTFLRVLFSMDGDKNFFNGLFMRMVFGLLVGVLGFRIVYLTAGVNLFSGEVFEYISQPPNVWAYSILILNYFGYFIHDYLYTGYFKVSNPFAEGTANFVCMMIMGIVVGITLNFADKVHTELYFRLYAVGISVARFFIEVFLSFKSRTFFSNNKPERDST
jgi:hypothetical protein